MKYAARIFFVFVIAFMISEISYNISVETLADSRREELMPALYLQGLDYSEPRAKGKMKLMFRAQGLEDEVARWMNIRQSEIAGMNEGEFAAYLDAFMLPQEMVEIGLTDVRLETFLGYEAVISVAYERPEMRRYRYWCRAEDGRIRVFDSDRKTLVLEQPMDKGRFTFAQLGMLRDGVYLTDYDSLLNFLAGEDNKGL